MAFSDEDLKRLKEKISKTGDEEDHFVYIEKAEALIARLAAAEKSIELVQAESPCNCIASPSGHSIFDAKCMRCRILEAWRKAAGRE